MRNFYLKTKSMGISFGAIALLNILRVPVCIKPQQSEELINLSLFMISSQIYSINFRDRGLDAAALR